MKLRRSHIEAAAEIFKEIDVLKDLLNSLSVAKDNPNAPRGINARIVIATFTEARRNPFDSERLDVAERTALCAIIEQFEREACKAIPTHRLEAMTAIAEWHERFSRYWAPAHGSNG